MEGPHTPEAYRPPLDRTHLARIDELFFDEHPMWIPDFSNVLPPRMPTGTDDEFAREFAVTNPFWRLYGWCQVGLNRVACASRTTTASQ